MEEIIGSGQEVTAVPAVGAKCTRCHRALKNAFVVGGSPYGPVCVRRLGFIPIGAETWRTTSDTSNVEDVDKTQLEFFVDTEEVERKLLEELSIGRVLYAGQFVDQTDPLSDAIVLVHRESAAYQLPLRLDVSNHSPTGFSWGYNGSGPAQLALAILCDYFGDTERAKTHYQDFKFKVIAGLAQDKPWTITSAQIEAAIG